MVTIICRTCAKCDFQEETVWLDIFHPNRWENELENIRKELNNWHLEVAQNDGLPQNICFDCFDKFCNVYTFRLACQEAQTKLKNIFDKIEIDEQTQTEIGNETNDKKAEPLILRDRNEIILLDMLELQEVTSALDSASTDQKQIDINNGTSVSIDIKNKNNLLPIDDLHDNFSSIEPSATTAINNDSTHVNLTVTNLSTTETAESQEDQEGTCEPGDVVPLIDDLIEEDIFDYDNVGLCSESTTNYMVTSTESNILTIDASHMPIESGAASDENYISFSYECQYCYKTKSINTSQSYSSQSNLLTHINTTHNLKYPYNCPFCQDCFQDVASRTTHIKDKHVEKHYSCETCGKKYADRFNLRNHIEKYHMETDFECDLCEKRFHSRKSLNYHMKWHNPDYQLKCSYCDRIFINQRHLKCHENTHTGVRKCETCTFCGKTFIHLKTLRWHLFRHHGGDKPYKCGNCTEVFSSYLDKRIHMLDNHLDNLTLIERTECMICHQRIENEAELKAHMLAEDKLVHKDTSIVQIKNNKRVLKNKRKRTCNGIFQCDVCNQRFHMKSALERHSKVHSTEGRPFSCKFCSKRFKRSQDMNWHMKTHSNEKPNICDVCGKGFALKYVLNQHRRSHEVLEKKFKCGTCGRSYLFEKTLRQHERIHSEQTYYKCDLCRENFTTHIKLKYHIQKVHSTNTQNDELPLDDFINIVIP